MSRPNIFSLNLKVKHVISQEFDNSPYISVYVALSVSAVLVTLVSGFVFQFAGVNGARNLHSDLLNTIMKVPMR